MIDDVCCLVLIIVVWCLLFVVSCSLIDVLVLWFVVRVLFLRCAL